MGEIYPKVNSNIHFFHHSNENDYKLEYYFRISKFKICLCEVPNKLHIYIITLISVGQIDQLSIFIAAMLHKLESLSTRAHCAEWAAIFRKFFFYEPKNKSNEYGMVTKSRVNYSPSGYSNERMYRFSISMQ